MAQAQLNKVRIIGGTWRGRRVPVLDQPGLRPTPDRVRETLFNWLQFEVAGRSCLDLFAGSGALGLEAASRGAKSVVQVEQNAKLCRQLKQNTQILQAQQIKVVQSEVFRFLASETGAYDLVFLDPPFGKGLAVQCCQWLEDKGWLDNGAKIYMEVEKTLALNEMPDNWQQLKSKSAGEVAYYLYQRIDL